MVILKILRSSRNFSTGEKIFGFINVTLLLIFSITMIYPFLYIATVSITPIEVLSKHGNIMIFPRGFSLDAYKFILESGIIPQGFLNSVFVTITGTFINLMMTSLMAYPLSIKKLPGRKFWLLFVLIPMVFSGGLIPLFILIKSLGMYDTFLALIIPGAIATYYLLIMKSFFQKLPESLVESALIDGAGQFRIFYALIIPLSKPVMASMALFYGMGHWNDFFKALMFYRMIKNSLFL
jgi:putative aldouronate transport system permease protein